MLLARWLELAHMRTDALWSANFGHMTHMHTCEPHMHALPRRIASLWLHALSLLAEKPERSAHLKNLLLAYSIRRVQGSRERKGLIRPCLAVRAHATARRRLHRHSQHDRRIIIQL